MIEQGKTQTFYYLKGCSAAPSLNYDRLIRAFMFEWLERICSWLMFADQADFWGDSGESNYCGAAHMPTSPPGSRCHYPEQAEVQDGRTKRGKNEEFDSSVYSLHWTATMQVYKMSADQHTAPCHPMRCCWIPGGEYPHFIINLLEFLSLLLLTSPSSPHSLTA